MTRDNLERGIFLKEQIESYNKILDAIDPNKRNYDYLSISGKYYADTNLDWIFDMEFTSELANDIRRYFSDKIKALEEEFDKL